MLLDNELIAYVKLGMNTFIFYLTSVFYFPKLSNIYISYKEKIFSTSFEKYLIYVNKIGMYLPFALLVAKAIKKIKTCEELIRSYKYSGL